MTDNSIGVEGAKSMSEMLKSNTTLTSLQLASKKWEMEREKKEMMGEWQVIRLELTEPNQ